MIGRAQLVRVVASPSTVPDSGEGARDSEPPQAQAGGSAAAAASATSARSLKEPRMRTRGRLDSAAGLGGSAMSVARRKADSASRDSTVVASPAMARLRGGGVERKGARGELSLARPLDSWHSRSRLPRSSPARTPSFNRSLAGLGPAPPRGSRQSRRARRRRSVRPSISLRNVTRENYG